MTSVQLPAKSYGIDAAGFAHLASFANAKAADYDFASLYVGGNFGVDKATVERVWAAGMAVQLNFERNANDALLGAPLGTTHAQQALDEARALGWLSESPIVFSGTDFGVGVVQFPMCDAYYHAIVNVFAGRPCGAYGPPSYLRHLAQQTWLPTDFVLWQWAGAGAPEWWTTAKQIFNPTHDVTHIGCSVDENVTIRPYPFWSGFGTDPIEPDPLGPTEDDMPLSQDDLNAIGNVVWNNVLALWRETEIRNTIQAGAQAAINTDETANALRKVGSTPVDVNAFAAALAPLLPGTDREVVVKAVQDVLSDATITPNEPAQTYHFTQA